MEEFESPFTEEQIEAELRYMHSEGLVGVEFHPQHPGCYKHAKYIWKSEEEIEAETQKLLEE